MLTPSDLLEIERKDRAYQAEEAANSDAKTCQRPTPELVLRLVEECKVLRTIISDSAQALGNGSHVEGCSTWLMAQLPKEIALVVGELRAKAKEAERKQKIDQEQCDRMTSEAGRLAEENNELRAKADQLREHSAGMGVELLGKDDTIKELRAKVHFYEETVALGNKKLQQETVDRMRLQKEVHELRAKVRVLEIKNKHSLANNLCSDHRDKQINKPCLACEIERLRAKVAELEASCTRWAERAADSTADRERVNELEASCVRLELLFKGAIGQCQDAQKKVAELQAIVDRLNAWKTGAIEKACSWSCASPCSVVANLILNSGHERESAQATKEVKQ